MSERLVSIECSWCEQRFIGSEAEAAAQEWFQLEHDSFEEPQDFCSVECLISSL